LRVERKDLAGSDPGFIYRTTTRSWIDFPPRFIRPLLVGVIGEFWTSFITLYVWLGLAALALLLVFVGKPRYAGAALALIALASAGIMRGLGIDSVHPALWWVPGIAAALALLLWLAPQNRVFAVLLARSTFGAIVPLALFAAFQLSAFVDGKRGELRIGPIPQGTPVNLIMNLNPEAPTGALIDALAGLTRGFLRIG
jgi:hypothetical protein